MDTTVINFRVWSIDISAYSYLSGQGFGPTALPASDDDGSSDNTTLKILVILLACALVGTCICMWLVLRNESCRKAFLPSNDLSTDDAFQHREMKP